MKKKKLIMIPLAVLCMSSLFSCRDNVDISSKNDVSESGENTSESSSGSKAESSSESTPSETHTHEYATAWSSDATKHWHDDTCGHNTKSEEAEHTYNDGEETAEGTKFTCTVCGYTKTEASKYRVIEAKWNDNFNSIINCTIHTIGTIEQFNYYVENGMKYEVVNGTSGIYIKENDKYYAYSTSSANSEWTKTEISKSDYENWQTKMLALFANNYSQFTYDLETKSYKAQSLDLNGTILNDIKVTFENDKITSCNYKMGSGDSTFDVSCYDFGSTTTITIPTDVHEHTYATTWSSDATKHWHAATCGHDIFKKDEAEHTMVDGKCSVCGYQECTDGIEYALSDDSTYAIVKGVEEGKTVTGDVVIASTYEGVPVTTIGEYAFPENQDITSVVISNGITKIGMCAFYGCINLTSITIPNSVETIGLGAFADCASLTSIEIPNSVTTIGNMAFYACGITSITIPNSVTDIGYGLFDECENLTNVTLSENITSIKFDTFYKCSKLTSVVIPNKVTSIGDSAFWKCSSLTSLVIPNSVTNIGKETFVGCTNLENITISSNLVSIGTDIFRDCDKLNCTEYDNANYLGNEENPYIILYKAKSTDITSCTISDKCKFIYDNAFKNCTSLTNLTISNSVISINTQAFYNCNRLSNLLIPNTIKYIGSNVFYGCSSLSYNENNNGEYLGNEENPYLVLVSIKNKYVDSFIINDNCKFICSHAIEYSNITSITIPNSVISISIYAFSNCKQLTSVTLPNNISILDEDIFYECSSITSIVIPQCVESMKNYVFDKCTSLTSVYYESTLENWKAITQGQNHDALKNVAIYYYSEEEPADTENSYWHYVNNVPTVW